MMRYVVIMPTKNDNFFISKGMKLSNFKDALEIINGNFSDLRILIFASQYFFYCLKPFSASCKLTCQIVDDVFLEVSSDVLKSEKD